MFVTAVVVLRLSMMNTATIAVIVVLLHRTNLASRLGQPNMLHLGTFFQLFLEGFGLGQIKFVDL